MGRGKDSVGGSNAIRNLESERNTVRKSLRLWDDDENLAQSNMDTNLSDSKRIHFLDR